MKQQISFHGNSKKSMTTSVDASLKKLRTHYIDILYVHLWDWTTTIEEIMNSLHNLVVQGKVLYLVGSTLISLPPRLLTFYVHRVYLMHQLILLPKPTSMLEIMGRLPL